MSKVIVFVHGWSVTNLDTYGALPIRLINDALSRGLDLKVEEIFLGQYISFYDEVSLQDISRAFDRAIKDKLSKVNDFVCITHSTGAPVVRDWLNRYYKEKKPPMSHLIMLAPANYGSALACLGKSTVSRLKNWFDGIEPGKKVLDWLELGSNASWSLNEAWIKEGKSIIENQFFFPFVLIGQSIDRKLYDHLNSYTGELGSDGVVRTSAANLNSRYIKLFQNIKKNNLGYSVVSDKLTVKEYIESYPTPMRVIFNKSHSGKEMGIMKSIAPDRDKDTELLNAIFDCVEVTTLAAYDELKEKFDHATAIVQENEKVEVEEKLLVFKRVFIHDRFSQIIFKVKDTEGLAVTDYDLIFTAGENSDPDLLPEGFAIDRQQNKNNPETITYYFNYDVMIGSPAIYGDDGELIRNEILPTTMLGLIVRPRPDRGFVYYATASIEANVALLKKVLKPNSSTLIEVEIQRLVSPAVFDFQNTNGFKIPSNNQKDFKNVKPGKQIIN